MMKQTFNLEVEMQLEEKNIKFVDNKFSTGDYYVRFLPPITYKYNNTYRIMEKLLYEVRTIKDRSGITTQTLEYKVVNPNSSPILLDKVEIEGITIEELKRQIDEFVPTISCTHE